MSAGRRPTVYDFPIEPRFHRPRPVRAYLARSSFKIMAPSGRPFRHAPRAPTNSGQQIRCPWFVDLAPRRPSEARGGHRQELQGRGVDAPAVLDQLHRPTSVFYTHLTLPTNKEA